MVDENKLVKSAGKDAKFKVGTEIKSKSENIDNVLVRTLKNILG